MQIKLKSLQDPGQISVDNYNVISRETNPSGKEGGIFEMKYI